MQALSNGVLRRANLDFAASPLHLGRGLSPYEEIEKDAWKNVNTFPGIFLYSFCTAHCHHESSSFPVYN